jgi:hypothetical protein
MYQASNNLIDLFSKDLLCDMSQIWDLTLFFHRDETTAFVELKIGYWSYGIACVHYHEDRCTKNKSMFWVLRRGLFLTCTENSFLYFSHTNIMSGCVLIKERNQKENTLTWKAVPCLWWPISHPLRSLAWSQLPLHPLLFPPPRICFPPKGH